MKPVVLTIQYEGQKEVWEISEFSMLEPSTFHCRFRIASGALAGQKRESHGGLITYTGDIDALPPIR
jgi:hypothetical protein